MIAAPSHLNGLRAPSAHVPLSAFRRSAPAVSAAAALFPARRGARSSSARLLRFGGVAAGIFETLTQVIRERAGVRLHVFVSAQICAEGPDNGI
jgi:hypothetical protein